MGSCITEKQDNQSKIFKQKLQQRVLRRRSSLMSEPQPQQPSKYEQNKIMSFVGFIQARFADNQVQYGTGIFLSQRLFLTCAHNIYDRHKYQEAVQVKIYPKIDKENDYLLKDAHRIIPKKPYFILDQYKKKEPVMSHQQKINYKIKEISPFDIAVLKIDSDLNQNQKKMYKERPFNIIPQFYQQLFNQQNRKLKIYGFNPKEAQGEDQKLKLGDEEGQILTIAEQKEQFKSFYVHYNNKTTSGFSGGPIFMSKVINYDSHFFLVGIHLQQRALENDVRIKTGLLLSNDIIDKIVKNMRLVDPKQAEKDITSLYKLKLPINDKKIVTKANITRKLSENSLLHQKGKNQFIHGNLQKSLELFKELKKNISNKSHQIIADLLGQIGTNLVKMKRFDQAQQNFRESLHLYEYCDVEGFKPIFCKVNLIFCLLKKNQVRDEINKYYQQVQQFMDKQSEIKIFLHIKLAEIEFDMKKKYKKSSQLLKKARELIHSTNNSKKHRDFIYLGAICHYEGLHKLKQNKFIEAMQFFFESSNYFVQGKFKTHPDFLEFKERQVQELGYLLEGNKIIKANWTQILFLYVGKFDLGQKFQQKLSEKYFW